MLAIGAGGMDVAVAMGGGAFYLTCPKVIGVNLKGKLRDWVASKDIILKMLSILSTKGNVGCVVEYFGDGVKNLTVPQRATVTNMGAMKLLALAHQTPARALDILGPRMGFRSRAREPITAVESPKKGMYMIHL